MLVNLIDIQHKQILLKYYFQYLQMYGIFQFDSKWQGIGLPNQRHSGGLTVQLVG